MRDRLRTLLIVVAVVAGLVAACLQVAKRIQPSLIFGLRVEFSAMPTDDVALENWLLEQPGVHRAYVNRQGNEIQITWLMSRNLLGNPRIPDCRQEFDRLGYQGLKRFEKN